MSPETLAAIAPAELEDAICQLQALENAVAVRQLAFLAAYDPQGCWADDGATSMAAWMSARLCVTYSTAAERLRVAHAFQDLPAIAEAFENGRLSWDQARAVTLFATPETDAELAWSAPGRSAAHLWRDARRRRRVPVEEAAETHEERSLRLWWDRSGRELRLDGRLPKADGAVVEKALELIALGSEAELGDDGLNDPWRARYADALVELASTSLASSSDADRATVVVHVDASVLGGGDGSAEIEGAGAIAAETARRLACDSRWQVILEDEGTPIGVGRITRQVPTWLERVLWRRDGGCVFPRCARTRWIQAHHLVPWALGGPTDLSNLVLLCSRHHHVVHEDGWGISGEPGPDLVFVRPDGRPLDTQPPSLRPEVWDRILGPRKRADSPDDP